jgi:hypothetical protein
MFLLLVSTDGFVSIAAVIVPVDAALVVVGK